MSHCILVGEDNPLNRELLCDWLEVEGYEGRHPIVEIFEVPFGQ